MEELVKKEPVTPSPNTTTSSRLVTLDVHTASSSSSRASSDSEKEIEKFENQFRGLEVKKALSTNPNYLNQELVPQTNTPWPTVRGTK